MHNYYFQEFFLVGQYSGSYDHSANTQYTRKEVFPANWLKIIYFKKLKLKKFIPLLLSIKGMSFTVS
jgi:hypothetical protein